MLHDALLAVIPGPRAWSDSNEGFIHFLNMRGIALGELERRHIDVDELRRRFALYRDLVHKRVRGVLDNCLPRTLRALGPDLDVILEHFMSTSPCASPHLRDLVADFVRFGAAHWSTRPELVPYLADLARYEWARLEVGSALDDTPLAHSEVSPQLTFCLRASTRLLALEHAVHLTANGAVSPIAGTYHVLVYRDVSNDAHTLQLSELAVAVIGALESGVPLALATENALYSAGLPLTAEHVAEVATLLNDLFTRGLFKRHPGVAAT